jgi:hypothetical protein
MFRATTNACLAGRHLLSGRPQFKRFRQRRERRGVQVLHLLVQLGTPGPVGARAGVGLHAIVQVAQLTQELAGTSVPVLTQCALETAKFGVMRAAFAQADLGQGFAGQEFG